jgi:hypothetical protein
MKNGKKYMPDALKITEPKTGPTKIPAPEAASRIPIFYYTSSGHLI